MIADYYRAMATITPYTSNFTSNGCFRLTLLSNIAFDIWMFWQGKITLTHNVYCNQNPNQIWTNTIRRYFMFTFLHFNTKKYENSLISYGIPFTYSHMNNIFMFDLPSFFRFFIEYAIWMCNHTTFLCLNGIHTFKAEEEGDGRKSAHWFFIYLWVICGLGQSGNFYLADVARPSYFFIV